MDQVQKQKILDIIQADYIYSNCLYDGNIVMFLIFHPTANIRYESNILYGNELDFAMNTGMMPSSDLVSSAIKMGMWSHKKDEYIEELYESIYDAKRSLLDFIFNKIKLEQHRKLLRDIENNLLSLLAEKSRITKDSAENYALMKQQRFLLSKITKHNDVFVWKTINDFNEDTNINTINFLVNQYFHEFNFGNKAIRYLARTDPWRSMWKAAKSGQSLFNKPICNWSENQIDIVRWSDIYDNIYGAYERPSDEIINDDDLLDSWIIRNNDKNTSNIKSNALDKMSSKSNGGRKEVFVMTDKTGSKDIYSANDMITRAGIQAKQKVISEKGVLKDIDAPDSKREIRDKLRINNAR